MALLCGFSPERKHHGKKKKHHSRTWRSQMLNLLFGEK
jgi:hypothetical protein